MIMADPSVWHLDTGEVILRTGLAVVFEEITGFGAERAVHVRRD